MSSVTDGSSRGAAPRALREGSHIRVVAPSSPFDVEALAQGIERLRARFVVSHRDDLFARRGFLAGDDSRRAEEIVEALDDESVDVLVAARGGHGATRILRALDVERVARANKPVVGFSDVTALHALWSRAGVPSMHGPMLATLGRAEPLLVDRWVRTLLEPRIELGGLEVVTPGTAEGPLRGGNLAVLAALVGTPFAARLDGAILFLEDVGEAPYRVDRMLTTLRESGALARVAGIALGAFTGSRPGDDGTTVEAVLRERLGDLGIPVVLGVPSGHVDDNHELWLGVPARLEAHASAGSLLVGSIAVARGGPPGVG